MTSPKGLYFAAGKSSFQRKIFRDFFIAASKFYVGKGDAQMLV